LLLRCEPIGVSGHSSAQRDPSHHIHKIPDTNWITRLRIGIGILNANPRRAALRGYIIVCIGNIVEARAVDIH